MPPDAQPDAGQGNEGSGGLFDPYLQTVPEEHREVVQSYLADAAKNVNGRLEEAATLRNTFGPYQEIEGFTQYDPESLGQLIQWHQGVTASPAALREFVISAAAEAGLTIAEAAAVEQEAAAGGATTQAQIAQLVNEMAEQRVAPLQERLDQFDFNRAVDSENQLITDAFTKIEAEAGVKLTDEQRVVIMDLGMAAMPGDQQTLSAGHDWVRAGFDRYRQVAGEAQKAFVDQKLQQPQGSLAPGGIELPQAATGWKEGSDRARERLRQSRST